MSQGKSPARTRNEPETKTTESSEFRQMLEKRERELIALSDERIQQLYDQIREKDNLLIELKDKVAQLQNELKQNARADEGDKISQQRIAALEKEIENMRKSEGDLKTEAKNELESTKAELKGLMAKKEDAHKEELDLAAQKWQKKIDEAEARLAECSEGLKSAEERFEAADDRCKTLKKQLDASRESQKALAALADASSRRENQNLTMFKEHKDKQSHDSKDANEEENHLQDDKDVKMQEEESISDLMEQLQEFKTHHAEAVDLFNKETDSLTKRLENATSQTEILETEVELLRREVEEKRRDYNSLEDKHHELHHRFDRLRDSAGGCCEISSPYSATSQLMFPGPSREVGTMRGETKSLLRKNKNSYWKPPSSPKKVRAGVKQLKEELKHLKSMIEGMSEDIGDLQAESPRVHCRTNSRRHAASPKRVGVSTVCRSPPTKFERSASWSQASSSLSPGARATSHRKRDNGTEAAVEKSLQIGIIKLSPRAVLETQEADMLHK